MEEKIKFRDLSKPLKVATVLAWMVGVQWMLSVAFLILAYVLA